MMSRRPSRSEARLAPVPLQLLPSPVSPLWVSPDGHMTAPPLAAVPPPDPMPVQLAPAWDGARLRHIDTERGGEVVVLLHSATGCTDMWHPVTRALSAAGFRVIAYDRRGHGGTVVDDPTALANTLEDLLSLLDLLAVDRAHFVGTAQGGRVANEIAVTHPDRVLTLTVASSWSGLSPAELAKVGISDSFWSRIRDLPLSLKELGAAYHAINPAGVQRWETFAATTIAAKARLGKPQSHGLSTSIEMLREISHPTLLLTGDSDPYSPPPLYRALATIYGNHELVVVPEAGHSVFWERPELFSAALLSFLQQHQALAPP